MIFPPRLAIFLLGAGLLAVPVAADDPVTLARDGHALLPIVSGSASEAADRLQRYLERISGASFERAAPRRGAKGIHVGLFSDFSWRRFDGADDAGGDGFLVDTVGENVFLLGRTERGASHAVSAFLEELGCRLFFPGDVWEVVPSLPSISGTWRLREVPSFPTQRTIWYGFGADPDAREDLERWNRWNRMGGAVAVSIGHTWHGLDPERDFEAHPEWFALVDGERQPSKPCYSHPEVLARAIGHALDQAARGKQMISMSPPDGLGYCECERCLARLGDGERFRAHRTLFAKRPGGVIVNVTSETLFDLVNRVAAAVDDKHPGTLVGCYAYSAYSHPPSFDLHPAVYLQTTTAFRRTPLALEEQLEAFGRKTAQLGIREYYGVFQWDWDYPDPGRLMPVRLQEDLRFYRAHGVTAVNAECSNNWGPRGLGYYLASRLLWQVDADVKALLGDFYEKAFGPAAAPMERYYVRWYGESAAVSDPEGLPRKSSFHEDGKHDVEALRDAFRDLDEAARRVRDLPAYARRVDRLRMYAHYLFLRRRLEEATASGDRDQIVAAIREETVFGGRLASTHMVHSRALLGKAFLRRFRRYREVLEDVPEAAERGVGWRKRGEPPDREELERLWKDDMTALGIGEEAP